MTPNTPRGWDPGRNADIADAIKRDTALRSTLSSGGRWISGALGLAYLAFSGVTGGAEDALRMLGFLLLPLVAIWFPDEIGAHIGGRITRGSPGWAVRAVGWLLLLTPAVALLIMRVRA